MPVTHVGAGHPGSTDAAAAPGVARRPCLVANCGVSTAGWTSHAEAAEAACPITARRMHLTSVSRSPIRSRTRAGGPRGEGAGGMERGEHARAQRWSYDQAGGGRTGPAVV